MAEIAMGDWSLIDEAAKRFEQAWKKGPRPRIEDFLAKLPEAEWPPLLAELLRVERELRVRAGENPTAEDYVSRFPGRDDVVTSVFASVPSASERPSPATIGGITTSGPDCDTSKLPPELVNHPDYEIIRELGQGGMGVVFLAHNRIMGRDEVLKVIGPDIVESPGVFDRFLREIRAVGRLQHPNIVTAHSAFRCGESRVFAMEYVEGLDLARLVRAKGPVPVGHACYFVHQVALGLQHAHEAGMVHRDIKPGNLMLTHKRGKALIKVLDFGLAKAVREQNVVTPVPFRTKPAASASAGLTLPGEMLGTPDFIAPEQIADSQSADIRADIYSLGCTLYFLLCGRPPFPSSSMRDTLRAHRSTEAPPLNLVRPEVPAELAAVVSKMMAKEPALRFQTPNDVAVALAPFYKKQALDSAAADRGAEHDHALNVGLAAAGVHAPAPATDVGMWSSLIDFNETQDDAAAVPGVVKPADDRPRWLWPAAAAGVLVCGLIGAWAAGIFNRPVLKKAEVELAGAKPDTDTGARKPDRVRDEPPAAGPGPGAEVSITARDNNNPPAAFGDGARAASPPLAETSLESKTLKPAPGTTHPIEVSQEITSITTPSPVTQARLVSDAGDVVFYTGGENRALWRVNLKDPLNHRKLGASGPRWNNLTISRDGRIVVLADVDNSLWYWDLQTGELRCFVFAEAPVSRQSRSRLTINSSRTSAMERSSSARRPERWWTTKRRSPEELAMLPN